MKTETVAQIGKAAGKVVGGLAWLYAKHLLTFAVGAFLGAFECFTVLWALGWRPQ